MDGLYTQPENMSNGAFRTLRNTGAAGETARRETHHGGSGKGGSPA